MKTKIFFLLILALAFWGCKKESTSGTTAGTASQTQNQNGQKEKTIPSTSSSGTLSIVKLKVEGMS